MEAVAQRLLALRMSVGLSQMKMAKTLGLTQPAVNRYEKNLVSIPDTAL